VNKFSERENVAFLYYPEGTRNEIHSHNNLESIYYIEYILYRTGGLVTVGEEKELVKTGDTVFIPQNTKHQVVNAGKELLVIFEVAVFNDVKGGL